MKQLFTHQRLHHQGANNLLHNVFAPLRRIALLALILCTAGGAWGQIWVKVNGGTEQQISSLSAITNPASVTSLEVTGGTFNQNNLVELRSGSFPNLEKFVIDKNTQVNIPDLDGVKNCLFYRLYYSGSTIICDQTYYVNTKLKEISIATITTLPAYFLAFHDLSNLEIAKFPDVTTLGTNAFNAQTITNTKLHTVYLPKLTAFSKNCFWRCDQLISLHLGENPPSFPKTIDAYGQTIDDMSVFNNFSPNKNRSLTLYDNNGQLLSGEDLNNARKRYMNPSNGGSGSGNIIVTWRQYWQFYPLYTVTYAKAGPGTGIITNEYDVEVTSYKISEGRSGTKVTAKGTNGYVFLHWDEITNTNPEHIATNVQSDITYTAHFGEASTQRNYIFTNGGQGGLVNGSISVTYTKSAGETVPSVEAQPYAGWNFVRWSDGTFHNPHKQFIAVKGTSDSTITAYFTNSDVYNIYYKAEQGKGFIEGPDTQRVQLSGNSIQVTAIANSGQKFVRWSDGRYDNPRQDVNVTKEIDVTAQFAPSGTKLYTLTYTAGQGGYIDGTATQQTAQGWNGIPVEAKPNSGYTFVRWSDGRTDNPRTDEDVRGNINVEAQFVKTDGTIWYTLTYNTTGDGSIVGPTTQLLPSGWNGVMVTANPGSDIFHRWSDGSTNTIHQATNITKDTTITAEFVPSGTTLYDLYYDVDDTKGNLIGSATQKVITPNGCGVEVEVVEIVPGTFLRWNDGNPKAKRKDCNLTTNPTTYTAEFVTSGTQIYKVKYIVDPDQGYFDGYAEQNVASDGCGIEIEAKGKPGYIFLRWSDGNPDAKRKDCGADIKGDATFTAEFVPDGTKIYTLTYSYNTSEGVLTTGHAIQNVAEGGCGVEVEIKEASGYKFLHWSDGSANPKRQDCNITSDTTITATFVSSTTQTYELKYYPEDRIDGPAWQRVVEGGNGVAVTAKENGDIFVRWSDGDTIAKRQDMNVTDNITVTAEFVPVGTPIYYVEYIAGTGGKIEPASLAKQKVPAGGNTMEIEAKGNPETDFMFTGWSDNLKTSKRSDKVTANAIYTANFTPTCCKTHWHYDTTKIAQNPCGEYTFQFPWGDTRDTVITDSETYTFTVRKDIGTGTCSAGSGIECDSLYILRVKFLPSTEHYFHVLVDDEFKYKGKTYTCSTANDTILYIFDDEYDISNCDTLKIYVHFNHPKPLSTSNVAAERINLYPNPTNTGFYIEAEAREVTVSSINGQLLHRQAISGKTYVDISHLPAGVYMVRAGSAVAKVVRI